MTAPSLPKNPSPKRKTLVDWVYIPALFLVIVLLGNYGIFLGHTFFVGETEYIRFHDVAGNMKSSGWRPDIGLGTTYFFGDPGTFHTWSPLRWWNHLFPNYLMGFNIFIVISLWVACFVQYIFLRKAVPDLEKIISFALASMIAFGPLRYISFFGQSSLGISPIVIPIIALLLYDFSKKPSIKHYFVYTLILTLSLVFGSSVVLLHSIFFSSAFFLVLICFNGWHQQWKTFLIWLGRFFLLNIATGTSIIILSGWAFYSIYLESQITGYVRDPVYGSGPFFLLPNLKLFLARLLEYIYSGVFSPWTKVLGIQKILVDSGVNCPFPLFPIILLLFLFLKTRNFWEYSAKFLILGFAFYQELAALSPGFIRVMQSIFLSPPINFDSVLHVFGIVAAGICLSRIRSKGFLITKTGTVFIQTVASFLCLLYTALFAVTLCSIFIPDFLNTFFLNVLESTDSFITSSSFKDMAPILISENVRLFHEAMSFSDLIFFGTTAAITGLFATKHGFIFMRWKRGTVLSLILAISQVFLAWTVYPMNSESLIWDRQIVKGQKLADMFAPTDRIMRVGLPNCSDDSPRANDATDYYDCVKNKFLVRDKGPRRWIVGYQGTPALELSAPKSVTQKQVSEFIHTFIELEFPELRFPEGIERSLQMGIPIYSSKFYDISGVKYLVSKDPIPKNNRLKLIYTSQQFFLYQYLDSWPYFYLADRIETIHNYANLYDAEQGVAYIWSNEPKVSLPPRNTGKNRFITLNKFEFDSMEFGFNTNQVEFLVISDAWHPQWRAKINGQETKIIKTNGVFKGVFLPPGQGAVELFFDNSPYKPGICISIIGWVLFLGGWLFFTRRDQPFKPVSSHSMV